MPKLYWMTGYNLREGKAKEYQKLLASPAFKKAIADAEKATGFKYVATYSSVIPNSAEANDYDCYEFWELPNRGALDKLRGREVAKLLEMTYPFTEPRPTKSILLRKVRDTTIIWEPKK
jgi:hypothetical protein